RAPVGQLRRRHEGAGVFHGGSPGLRCLPIDDEWRRPESTAAPHLGRESNARRPERVAMAALRP
ncbi:MAG: hypothetical protein KDK75_23690, partial [Alphaproteobacteria bacterium]|nr:hypothetical protein [Alphaproteobacteria bacterium]